MERYNRTILNKVRALLYNSNLLLELWGEALNTAVYLYNRTLYSQLPDYITPYKALYKQKPNISNIRVFSL